MDFPLPPVGEGLLEVELVRWLVRAGDVVARGQGLAEVMSDKASMEVPSPFAGTITALAATPGTKIKVGQAILSYDAVGDRSALPAGVKDNSPSGPLPEGKASSTDTFSELHLQGVLDAPSLPLPEGSGRDGASSTAAGTNGHSAPLPPAAPSVRLLARKFGVDLARVRGTGPHGRILLDDLTPFLTPKSNGEARPAATNKTDTSKLDFGVAGTRQKLIGLRRRVAERMVESKRHIPHYSYIDECDLTDAVKLRNQLREPLAKAGVKLTYLAFFVKAVARALKEVPIVNSTYDEAAGEVALHDRYHIGVAVAAPGGLLVPVVRDADKKDIATIAADIDRLSSDAKAGRSKIDDLRGSTFTVTSVGGIGGLISTPIINYPEVGIMGVGKVVKRPTYDANGALKPSDIVFLSFSFDHRVLDGAIGAAFGNAVVRYLQTPAVLLLPEAFGG
ncbi:Dihydrolipoyllysine-residue acetyltransferase component of pyruvate dehydrogenase complex [Gemmata obscuriglobus]|uniref:Dihydrolipoamide acetyltransferase component of pyruvate dehydrogenase complex n=1 Tax=Gemmata obscuriglobus TaxID=114 RepID=A0A2Z3HBN2_9BACT|nr:dihydrolipoamide acetyltransferase family protein [Gemmata obscuriglobus]AWM40947.1 2-oxo acid dehydrogenase subunit E2 [Gemmata obscuriglobus]QEG25744.1 Dihydrolipoyllysine-residue acetyltransferase component of pyruvate dehydrogenase complex [Gemmata obscuriglobus]VTR99509.1 branched-chain alpha-keto acid dehydrogenase subunit e2 : Uncultured bacterium genome assembly Metasoil_fosmids_resub OS=uncultured bacterium PE=4 SV=1: Biotin_lipoyl: E3_binding: 2-oxoacid_dh [Gemmata obscuriglobus UQM